MMRSEEKCLNSPLPGNSYDMNGSNVIDLTTRAHRDSISEIHVLTSLLLVTSKQVEDHAKAGEALRTRTARSDELVDLVFNSSIEAPSRVNPQRLVAAA